MTQECKYCGPNCQRGAGHNARVEAGDVYMAQEEKIIPALNHARNCASWFNGLGHEVNGEDCTCGLRWRIHLGTEQTMHAAWRKRAEEAESALATQRLRKMIFAEIDKYQDIFSWQSGESRNALVCDIRNDIDKRLAALSPQEPQDGEKEVKS